MAHRALVYNVPVHQKFKPKEEKPLGNVDGNGAYLAEFLEKALSQGFASVSHDGNRDVTCERTLLTEPDLGAVLRPGERGVRADSSVPEARRASFSKNGTTRRPSALACSGSASRETRALAHPCEPRAQRQISVGLGESTNPFPFLLSVPLRRSLFSLLLLILFFFSLPPLLSFHLSPSLPFKLLFSFLHLYFPPPFTLFFSLIINFFIKFIFSPAVNASPFATVSDVFRSAVSEEIDAEKLVLVYGCREGFGIDAGADLEDKVRECVSKAGGDLRVQQRFDAAPVVHMDGQAPVFLCSREPEQASALQDLRVVPFLLKDAGLASGPTMLALTPRSPGLKTAPRSGSVSSVRSHVTSRFPSWLTEAKPSDSAFSKNSAR